jgi:hypothetical protein
MACDRWPPAHHVVKLTNCCGKLEYSLCFPRGHPCGGREERRPAFRPDVEFPLCPLSPIRFSISCSLLSKPASFLRTSRIVGVVDESAKAPPDRISFFCFAVCHSPIKMLTRDTRAKTIGAATMQIRHNGDISSVESPSQLNLIETTKPVVAKTITSTAALTNPGITVPAHPIDRVYQFIPSVVVTPAFRLMRHSISISRSPSPCRGEFRTACATAMIAIPYSIATPANPQPALKDNNAPRMMPAIAMVRCIACAYCSRVAARCLYSSQRTCKCLSSTVNPAKRSKWYAVPFPRGYPWCASF